MEGFKIEGKDLSACFMDSIRAKPAQGSDPRPVGASRIGGDPELPENMEWPYHKNRPLEFVAQINMADLQPFRASFPVLETGILYFFYDAEEQPWGFDPADKGGWKVVHSTTDGPLSKRSFPGTRLEDCIFEAAYLDFAVEPSAAPYDSPEVAELNLSPEEEAAFEAAAEGFLDHYEIDDEATRLFGFPDQVQGSMPDQCALVSAGVDLGDSPDLQSVQTEELRQKAHEWILLFQLGSVDCCDMMWGDCGKLYFWIRKEDLAVANFENVWLVLQCF